MTNQSSIVFTKLFVSGNLEGLTYIEFLSFPDIASSTSWLEGVRKNVETNKLNWNFTSDILFYEDTNRIEAIEDYKLRAS